MNNVSSQTPRDRFSTGLAPLNKTTTATEQSNYLRFNSPFGHRLLTYTWKKEDLMCQGILRLCCSALRIWPRDGRLKSGVNFHQMLCFPNWVKKMRVRQFNGMDTSVRCFYLTLLYRLHQFIDCIIVKRRQCYAHECESLSDAW